MGISADAGFSGRPVPRVPGDVPWVGVCGCRRPSRVRLAAQGSRPTFESGSVSAGRVNEKGIVTSDDALQWESDAAVVVERSEWTVQSCNEEWKRERRLVRVHLPNG